MNFKILCICIISLAISSSAIGMEIERSSLMVPKRLGNIRLFHKDNNFVVEQDGMEKHIQPCFVSPVLRNARPGLLSKFLLADGYLKLSELKKDNCSVDYKLDACGRLRGGGPFLGGFTFIAGSLATAAAATGVLISTAASGPGAIIAVVATVKAGMAATAYATIVATGAPTP